MEIKFNYPSDDTLLRLNESIEVVLSRYLDGIGFDKREVEIRFDLPNPEKLPDNPAVSVFLYDIQEDLQLRHGESRQYTASTGKLQPGYVHIRCCYLITYWATKEQEAGDDPSTGPRSESMIRMNKVLNALLNTRTLPNLPGSYTRVIPPSEQLNSLGNFWQSLGDKPRLSLSYAVTVPIRLTDKEERFAPTKEITTTLTPKPEGDVLRQVEGILWQKLYTELQNEAVADGESKQNSALWLSKVRIRCIPMLPEIENGQCIEMQLSGVTQNSAVRLRIQAIAKAWKEAEAPVCEIEGWIIRIGQIEMSELEPTDLRG